MKILLTDSFDRFAAGVLSLVAAAALAAPAAADDQLAPPPPTPAIVSTEPVFEATTIDGERFSAQLRALDCERNALDLIELTPAIEGAKAGEERRPTAHPRSLRLDHVFKLQRREPPPPFPPEGAQILFPQGDRLRAVLSLTTETNLLARSFLLGDVSIPLGSIQGMILSPPVESDHAFALRRSVLGEPKGSEMFWLMNGDRLVGGFLGLDVAKTTLRIGGKEKRLDRTGVQAIGFDPTIVEYPEPQAIFLDATLSDGSRLGLEQTKIDQGLLRGKTRFGVPIAIPLGEVARLQVRGGGVVFLDDRPATDAVYIGYLGAVAGYRRGENVEGDPLKLNDQTYDRGIGMQSRTLLAYKLEPNCLRFQAEVGVDDRAGPLGSVSFRVLVDGKEKYASPVMTAREDPRRIDVAIKGGRVLILAVEFGERGDVRDLADWVEARLILDQKHR